MRRLRRSRRNFRRFVLVCVAIFITAAVLLVLTGGSGSDNPTTMALLTAIAFVALLASCTSLVGFVITTVRIWRVTARESEATEAAKAPEATQSPDATKAPGTTKREQPTPGADADPRASQPYRRSGVSA